jgi:hypothetical protein
MNRRRHVLLAHRLPVTTALVLLVSFSGSVAFAECPLPPGASPELARYDADTRLAFIRGSLLRDAQDSTLYTTLWVAGNGLLLAGTGGLTPFYPASQHVSLYVGIGATAIAALPLVLLAPSIERDGPAFERYWIANSSADICDLIRTGEHLLAKDAIEETGVGGWLPQTINVVYNLGVALILAFVFKQWQTGVGAFFSGTAIGEAVMLTQPKELPNDLKRYMNGDISQGTSGPVIGLTGPLNFAVKF